ncbi:hypothetical protein [Microcystis sp. M037S2]|nr:hypothetical protein [Microcystis sp. M037S2]MCA2755867.1 hypothetical protein [Microcystis sp. M137S2]
MDTQQTEQIVKELNSFIKNLDRWATQLQTATVILPIRLFGNCYANN